MAAYRSWPWGEADDWGNPALTCRAFAGKLRADQAFELHTYPDTFHAFDDALTSARKMEGHQMGYNHEAAADSFRRVRAFLDRNLTP